MLFYYIVIETIEGMKQPPIVLSDTELKNKIDALTVDCSDQSHSIITEKAGWYRVTCGSKKNYLRYKNSK